MYKHVKNQFIPISIIRSVFLQIVKIIIQLHNIGVIHGDLSCENFIIDQYHNVYLVDFGMAQLHHAMCTTLGKPKYILAEQDVERNTTLREFYFKGIKDSTYFLGKTLYMSPELYQSQPFCGYKNDIFALGQILFMLCTTGLAYKVPNETIDNEFHQLYTGSWMEPPSTKSSTSTDLELECKEVQQQPQQPQQALYSNLPIPMEAKDLINRIIKPEQDRISLSDMLNHPFLNGSSLISSLQS